MLRKQWFYLIVIVLLLALAACRSSAGDQPATTLPTPIIPSPMPGTLTPAVEAQATATATPTVEASEVPATASPSPTAGATVTSIAVATIPATAAPPTAVTVVNTSVTLVLALTDVNIRSGPGTGYSVVGWVAEGQMARVTGLSGDGTWWRVVCPDGSVGSCWVTAGSGYTRPAEAPATATSQPGACRDAAQFVGDVTVPDGSQFPPRTGFVKTWRVRNAGTCTWDNHYTLVFHDGDPMGAMGLAFGIPGPVAPGGTVDVSASLVSPPNSGSFRGRWLLEDSHGRRFGVGSSGMGPLTVVIEVTTAGTNGSISGFVWADDNRNGGLDSGEGRSNMTVLLFGGEQCQSQLQVTYTGPGGAYRFSNLSTGSYCVIVAGQTAYLAERHVDLVGGQQLENVNPEMATSPAPATIRGLVYEDQNRNGLRDGSEPGVGNLQVRAYAGTCAAETPMLTTTTAANGTYTLYPLEPMMVCIGVLDPRGIEQSTMIIPLASNATANVDLAVVLATQADPGTLTGTIYQDNNNNGRRDSGEPGVQGRDVWLYPGRCQGPEPIFKTTSGTDGIYTFKPLAPQQYCVEVRGPGGNQEDMSTVGLPSGQIVTLDLRAGLAQPATAAIGGRLWSDYCELTPQGQWQGVCVADGNGSYRANGLYENSESGIAGVIIRLQPGPCGTDNPAVQGTTLTDAQGFYRFNGLQPGTYCVLMNAAEPGNEAILLPGDWTYPAPGIWYREVTLATGEQRTGASGIHFGWDYQLK